MATINKFWLTNLILTIFLGSLLFGGCATTENSSQSSSSSDNLTAVQSVVNKTSSKEMFDNLPRLEGKAKVKLVVNGSPIIIEVDGIDAPITAGNFVDLVQRGVYNGLVFHRVIKSPQPFVAQGGDPLGNGTGGFVDPETGKKRSIPLEIKLSGDDEPTYSKGLGQQSGIMSPNVVLKHNRGAVAMARSQAPDSASSQFYIALAQLDFLDGDYAVFGQVIEGMDVVDGIDQGDIIVSAEVIEGIENLKQ